MTGLGLELADLIIIAVVVISTLVSLLRGFIRESLSLLIWVVAAWVGLRLATPIAELLTPWVAIPSARLILGFVAVFVAVVMAGSLLGLLVAKLISSSGLSGTDRMLGMLFGAMRGVVMVVIAVLVLSLTPVVDDPWWQQSMLLPYAEDLAAFAVDQLPEGVQARIDGILDRD